MRIPQMSNDNKASAQREARAVAQVSPWVWFPWRRGGADASGPLAT
jgi:hypothetical protein